MGALFARDVYVASSFGRTPAVDGYFLALMLPQMGVQIVGSGVQASVVPAYTRLAVHGDSARSRRFVEALTARMLLLSGAVTLLLWGLGGLGLGWLGRNSDPSASRFAEHLLCVLLPLTLSESLGALWAALLSAEDQVAVAIASRIAVPIGAVLMLALFARSAGVDALAWGTVLGSGAQLVWRGLSLSRIGHSVVPRLHRRSAELRGVVHQYLPMMLGGAVGSLTNTVDNAFAALSAEPAAVSALNYGSRVTAVLTTAGTVAVGVAVLPYLARLSANRRFGELRRTIRIFVCLILALALPLTALIVIFSQDLVRLLFQHGQFSARDTVLVARIQQLSVLQVPVFVTGMFLIRVISALGRNHLLLYITIGNVCLNALLDYLLMRVLGVAGIALATSIVYLVSTSLVAVSVYLLLRAECPALESSEA